MNILYVWPEIHYCCGVSQHILMLATNLLKRNHRVVVAANGGTMVTQIQERGIRFEKISFDPTNKGIKQLFETSIQIIDIVRRHDIHIVHSHHRWVELIVLLSKPVHHAYSIMTCHNLLFGKKWISYRSDKIIAVSNTVQHHLITHFHIDPAKITVIRNAPRDFERSDAAKVLRRKENLGISEKCVVVGGFGRLHAEKGFDILVEALKLAAVNGYQFECLLAGEGPERNVLEKTVEEHKLKVHFLGEVSNLSIYYEMCDIIVIPSRTESSGLVALEAASHRKAVIASAAGGLKEIITHRVNGLAFDVDNAKQLCEELIELSRNQDLRNRCAHNLHILLKESYSIDKMISTTEAVYTKALESP